MNNNLEYVLKKSNNINNYVFIIIVIFVAAILALLSVIFIEEPSIKLKKMISQKFSNFREKLCKQ